MKKFYLLTLMMIAGIGLSKAQETVDFDANATFLGFANVFETPANGGGFVFGQAWGVPDLKTVIDTGAGTATLQPNFNTWDPGDPFWVTAGGEANKVFEGNTYVEDNTLIGSEVTFSGNCNSFTLDAGYQAKAFIKVFNSDFSVVKEVNTTMTAGENFSVTYTDVEAEDTFLQYGFAVTGLIADPVLEPTLGSVIVSAPILSINDVETLNVVAYPNPVQDNYNIQSAELINNVNIYNMLGQNVFNVLVNDMNATLDLSRLEAGLYIANIATEKGNKVIRLVKN